MKRNSLIRIFAGLLCLFLVVGVLPAEQVGTWLGDLIPDVSANNVSVPDYGQKRLNGLFVIRSYSRQDLAISSYYINNATLSKYDPTNSEQIFILKNNYNTTSTDTSKVNEHVIHFRTLQSLVYNQYYPSNYGNLWMCNQEGTLKMQPTGSSDTDYTGGVPEGNNKFKFEFRSAGTTEDGKQIVYIRNPSAGYVEESGGQLIFTTNTSGTATKKFILEPVYCPNYVLSDVALTHALAFSATSSPSYSLSANTATGFTPMGDTIVTRGDHSTYPSTWSIVKAESGYYYIINRQYDRYLTMTCANGHTGVLTLGHKAHSNDGDWVSPSKAEKWQLVPVRIYTTNNGNLAQLGGIQTVHYMLVNAETGLVPMFEKEGLTINAPQVDSQYLDKQSWLISGSSASFDRPQPSGYWPTTFDSNNSIQLPMYMTTSNSNAFSPAYSALHTLKLNHVTNTAGTPGYVFDTSLTNSITAAPFNNSPAISYTNGIVQNTQVIGRHLDQNTNTHKYPFNPTNTGNYHITLKFQFTYQTGQFFNYTGSNSSMAIYDASGQTLQGASLSGLKNGTVYTLVFTKNTQTNTHFSIFTNIVPYKYNIVETTAMTVEANVWQNNVKCELNGVANINALVEYRVKVTNNSMYSMLLTSIYSENQATMDAGLGYRNLGGLKIDTTNGLTAGLGKDSSGNSLSLNELTFVVINPNGKDIASKTPSNVAELKDFLTNVPLVSGKSYGLPTGYSIEVRGIYYKISNNDIQFGRKVVYFDASSTFHGSGATTATHTKSKNTAIHFTNEPFFVKWADQDLVIDVNLLLTIIQKAGKHTLEWNDGLKNANAITSILLIDDHGVAIQNSNVSISNKIITFTHSNPDTYQHILRIAYSGGQYEFAVVPIQVFVYDVSDDNTFVLDYGLPVEIPKDKYITGTEGAVLNKAEHNTVFGTGCSVLGITGTRPDTSANIVTWVTDNTTAYATISRNATTGAITYTPTAFMNGADYIYVVFKVERNSSNTKLGVDVCDYAVMYKTITILPGNVVYYEDSLAGITYPNETELEVLGSITAESTGNKVINDNTNQDFKPGESFGHDDGYANSKDVTVSGVSTHKIPVAGKAVSVKFSFTGTGFELISRCNAWDSATIIIKVGTVENDPNAKIYPVITRFNPNGTYDPNNPQTSTEVYQTPVFQLMELTYATHYVEIVGLPAYDYDTEGNIVDKNGNGKTDDDYTLTYLYVDGIRVYNPIKPDNELTNEYGDEKGAQFENLRDLILAGKGMMANYTDSITDFVTGNYYYLGHDSSFTAALGNVNQLGAIGANNEIYVRRSAGNTIVVLKVKDNGNGLLQIGIHDVHDGMFDGNGLGSANNPTTVFYRTTGSEKWTTLVNGTYSGTEQYYNIDLSQCPTDGEYKLVILRVDEGFASFSNIKYKNVEFGMTGAEVLKVYTERDHFFDEYGNVCTINKGENLESTEDDTIVIVTPAADLININTVNNILAQNESE